MSSWHPASWQNKPPSLQAIAYPCPQAAQKVSEELAALPPLITPLEVNKLIIQLAEAGRGERFILQGGDCAESFKDCTEAVITNKLKILLQMSLILLHGLGKPITRIGRIAGQYAKPRSSATEQQGDIILPTYRGEVINDAPFTKIARTPDPQRMLTAYYKAGLTLNYLRALVTSGFADLHHPEKWNLDFLKHAALAKDYQHVAQNISNALNFIKLIPGANAALELNRVEFYTAHEALHLPYEEPLTRQYEGRWYNLATHYPWLGKRTATLDSAHVEYMRGIANPLSIKIDAGMKEETLLELISLLNPENTLGRLTLTHRLGAKQIAEHLPKFIQLIQQHKLAIVWCCDPMHGNTETTPSGIKTRHFSNILSELQQAFAIHKQMGSILGGVHFELTGENVTECIGGARGLTEQDLERAYTSLVDPRLNYEQALEMAMLIVQQ